jgi:beta-amylase
VSEIKDNLQPATDTQTGGDLSHRIADIANQKLASDFLSASGHPHKAVEQPSSSSYLEAGIDKVASLVVSDKETRKTIDHYGSEILTTAALFAGGKKALVGTALLYGLANTSTNDTAAQAAADFSLGAVKGLGTKAIFTAAGNLPTAPLKGVVTGIASRALDDVASRDSFTHPSDIGKKLSQNTLSGSAMLADAATWTIGEGLFHGINKATAGKLAESPLAKGVTMGASFGAVNGTNSEIQREKAAGEELDALKIAKNGLVEAVIGGIGAGAGMRATNFGGMAGVHISEARGGGIDPKGQAVRPGFEGGPVGSKEGGKQSGKSVSIATAVNLGGEKGGTPTGEVSAAGRTFNLGDLAALKAGPSIPEFGDPIGTTPLRAKAESKKEAEPIGPDLPPARKYELPPDPPGPSKEYVVDSGKAEFKKFRDRKADGALLNVRELFRDENGKENYGPKKVIYVQKIGVGDVDLKARAAKADIIVSSHPELLSEADRAKHVFPNSEGKVWMSMSGKGSTLKIASGDVQVGQWKKEGFVDPVRLDNGYVSLSVMAPLMVGDAKDVNGDKSRPAWQEFDRQLQEAKNLGIDAVSTDVWWGLIEPKKGEFDWSYYEKLSDHITAAGLKWVPILSFHQCGGNVGDDVNVPIPEWIWGDVASRASGGDTEAVKYKSEQGHTSPEYVSLFADHAVMDNYASVMNEFQTHFAAKAKNIGEVNVSLGPAGELRYPSYNAHDTNAGYPTRGALQSYGPLAVDSFREYVEKKYGGHDAVGQAWKIDNLDDSHILPPDDPNGFFARGDHFNTQYGRDFFDWYNQSLVDHGNKMLSTAVSVFGQRDSAFYGIDLGAKVPGVHWRVGEMVGGNVQLSDRLAELDAGLIRTSAGDWDKDTDGRGYRPIFSMFKSLQPLIAGRGTRIVPGFTCLEMPDGDGGPSIKAMPHTLATWVGMEAERQGLHLKGENALNGNLYNKSAWDLMRGFLTLPNQHGYYHGLTFLRMTDIVNNDTARANVSSINSARTAMEQLRSTLRTMFGRPA